MYLVKKHLDALEKLNVNSITRATFVVAPSNDFERDNEVINYVKDVKLKDHIKLDAYIRTENTMLSYGSWNDAMIKNIENNEHFFLIEDDYFPNVDDFYSPFISQMKRNNSAYVCQLWTDKFLGFHCAAISNGLMNINAARMHYDKFNECFALSKLKRGIGNSYQNAEHIQMKFLDSYKNIGFSISDVADEYAQPFLQPDNRIFLYGNRKGIVLIKCENFGEIDVEPATFLRYDKVKKRDNRERR